MVYADLGTGGVHGRGSLADYLPSIENVVGGSADDVPVGDGGVNPLSGGAGGDLPFGMDGDDTPVGGGASSGSANLLFGGSGNDTADYSAETAIVYATIEGAAGYVGGLIGASLRDSYGSIENVPGGSGNDLLVGNAGVNTLAGGGGSDVLFGRDGDDVPIGGGVATGGYNQLFGGNGNDTADYGAETAQVTASLGGARACVGGVASTDLRDISNSVENLAGGGANDVLVGDGLDNVLKGGVGADQLYGGSGANTFVYTGYGDSNVVTGYDTVADFVAGIDKIDPRAMGTDSSHVVIPSGVASTKLWVEVAPGVFVGATDLAIPLIGTNAPTVVDILFWATRTGGRRAAGAATGADTPERPGHDDATGAIPTTAARARARGAGRSHHATTSRVGVSRCGI